MNSFLPTDTLYNFSINTEESAEGGTAHRRTDDAKMDERTIKGEKTDERTTHL